MSRQIRTGLRALEKGYPPSAGKGRLRSALAVPKTRLAAVLCRLRRGLVVVGRVATWRVFAPRPAGSLGVSRGIHVGSAVAGSSGLR